MKEADLTISAIIPLYNGAEFIAQALDSVFAQELPPTEVIVVDDGSTDNGPEIVDRYAETHPVRLLRKTNAGQSSARNFGIRHSRGALIALLDQDDVWYPNHLAELSRPFANSGMKSLGWTYSNLDEIGRNNRLRVRGCLSLGNAQHPKLELERCLGEDMFILPSSSLIRRSAYDAVGGFDEALSGYEDDDLFLRMFVAGYRNAYIEEPLGQWRVYPSSSSFSPRMAKSRMAYARKLLNSFPDEPRFGRRYGSQLIVPRFLPQAVDEARVALRYGHSELADACLADIVFLEQHISSGSKTYPLRKELLISVVIPLYNGADFIRSALRGVLQQTLPADEIIVVDCGSSDSGPDIVREIAGERPIRLIDAGKCGRPSAMNLGIDRAHGDLIAFLDPTDVWYVNHLDVLLGPFLEQRAVEVGCTYADVDEIETDGSLIARNVHTRDPGNHPRRDLASCVRQDMRVHPSACMISRRALKAVGGFDSDVPGYEDDDLFLRLFQAGFDSVYFSQPLTAWRVKRASRSDMQGSRAAYARKLIARFPDDPGVGRFYVRDYIAPRFFPLVATEMRKAVLEGTRGEQADALDNLALVIGHMPGRRGLLLRTFLLPALRVPALARIVMRYRLPLFAIASRILK